MQPEEFSERFHVRPATGPCSCTGETPCVHSALHKSGWYCRLTLQFGGSHLALGDNPDRVVCDRHTPYTPGPNPGPLSELGQRFRAYA